MGAINESVQTLLDIRRGWKSVHVYWVSKMWSEGTSLNFSRNDDRQSDANQRPLGVVHVSIRGLHSYRVNKF